MNLPYRHYQFTFVAQDQLLLPYYKGSTFRGAFGNAFKRIVCTLRRQDCKTCILRTGCIYAYVFETAPHPDATIMGTGKYTSIPHPFVIEPPLETDRDYQPGEEVSFGLILIGKAVDYFPYFAYTFEEMGKTGIGKRRGKYSLRTVKTDDGGLVYSHEGRTIRPQEALEAAIPEEYTFNGNTRISVKVSFLTPARISYGRDLVVSPDFQVIVRSLLRRLNLLSYFHGEKREATWNHRAIIAAAGEINMSANHTHWWDWERYSSRQGVRMKMGGIIGKATYEGDIEPFLPLLRAGEIFHLGKGTSFGLGKYEIVVGVQ